MSYISHQNVYMYAHVCVSSHLLKYFIVYIVGSLIPLSQLSYDKIRFLWKPRGHFSFREPCHKISVDLPLCVRKSRTSKPILFCYSRVSEALLVSVRTVPVDSLADFWNPPRISYSPLKYFSFNTVLWMSVSCWISFLSFIPSCFEPTSFTNKTVLIP